MRPVIVSVGNLAMGGRGKTPLAAHLARLFLDAGEKPAIISRGYRRRRGDDGAVIVSDGADVRVDVDTAGDEPLMLAEMVPGAAVVVCDVRAVAVALAESALGATVHVLDDGFQHRAVRRDVDLVLVSPADLRGRRLPFGRLRESVSALGRADAVIVDGDEGTVDPTALPVDAERTRLFAMTRTAGEPVPLDERQPLPAGRPAAVAVAGIAAPERFADSLRAAGWPVADQVTFGDHHHYGRADVERISSAVARSGAAIVLTTAKDAVKLRGLRPWRVPVGIVPLRVTVEPASEFRTWLFERVRKARA